MRKYNLSRLRYHLRCTLSLGIGYIHYFFDFFIGIKYYFRIVLLSELLVLGNVDLDIYLTILAGSYQNIHYVVLPDLTLT